MSNLFNIDISKMGTLKISHEQHEILLQKFIEKSVWHVTTSNEDGYTQVDVDEDLVEILDELNLITDVDKDNLEEISTLVLTM